MKEQIEEMAKVIEETERKKMDTHCDLPSVEEYATDLYNAGYRKQSEVVEEYRQKVNTKMGKHTHLLGKEYVQRILREVAKEMKGGAE